MRSARRFRRSTPLLLGHALAASCGGPQELGGSGTDCFRDDDCEPGLVCVAVDPARPGDRVCSSDVSVLVSQVPGPTEEAGGAPAVPAAGGAPADNSGGAPTVPATGGTAGTGGTGDTGGTGGSTGGTGGTATGGTAGSGGTTTGTGGAP